MSTVSPIRLLTAEEFAKLPDPPDGSRQELVRGEVVTMPPPGGYHGIVCSRVDRRVGVYVENNDLGHVTCNDSGVILDRDPDTVRGPDVAFWSRERLPAFPRTGYPQIAPDMVAEVMSPSDVFSKVMAKVRQYLTAGVRLVWILVPDDQSMTVYRPNGTYTHLTAADPITGEDVLPGFSCPVAQFFP
jgi:Uma2 family endonuclease